MLTGESMQQQQQKKKWFIRLIIKEKDE